MDYEVGFKTCESCRKDFKIIRRRFWCEHCNKYFYICPTCMGKYRIPCPYCGTGLKKKAEPLK